MRRHVAALLLAALPVFIEVPAGGQAPERPLTNSDIAQMTRAGLGDDVIIRKILYTDAAFSLAAEELVILKAAGVSEGVLLAMLDKQKTSREIAIRPVPAAPPAPAPAAAEPSLSAAVESKKACWALVSLPETSRVVFVVLEDVNHETKNIGDGFWLQAYRALDPAAVRLIPAGAKIQGIVTHVQKPGRFSAAQVRWVFARLVTPNGYEAQLFPADLRLRYWDFEKDRATRRPKNRLPQRTVEQLATLTPRQTLALPSSLPRASLSGTSYYSGITVYWTEPVRKEPEEALLAGTGIVVQFKRVSVPLPSTEK